MVEQDKESAYKRSLRESLSTHIPGVESAGGTEAQDRNKARENLRNGEKSASDFDETDNAEEGGFYRGGGALDVANEKVKGLSGQGVDTSREEETGAMIGNMAGRYYGGGSAVAGKAGEMIGRRAGKIAGRIKKAMPALLVIIFLGGAFVIGSAVQSLMSFSVVNNLMNKFNSVTTSPADRSNAFLNMQLSSSRGSSQYGETIYDADEFKLTDYEKKSLASMGGIEYTVSEDGTKALTYVDSGEEIVVVSDDTIGSTGLEVAEGGFVSDITKEEEKIAERKHEVLAALDKDSGSVRTVSEALNDPVFKSKYIKGTRTWRGQTASWYDSSTSQALERLGISKARNTYEDWKTSTDYNADYDKFVEQQKNEYASAGSVSEGTEDNYQSLKQKAKEVIDKVNKNDGGKGCAAMSAIQEIHSTVTAQQRYVQQNSALDYLESIQKTQYGKGDEAPLNVYNNIMVQPDENGKVAVGSKGMAWVFEQGDFPQSEAAYAVSTESITSTEKGALLIEEALGGEAKEEYNQCNYVESASGQTGKKGLFSTIKDILSGALSTLKGWLGLGKQSDDASDEVLEAIDPALKEYAEMMDNEYFLGTVGSELGDAVVSSSNQLMSEVAKGEGMSIADEETVIANYRSYQEVLAENAQYERETKSPFDVTSQNTFLGSLVHKTLIPMAISVQSSSSVARLMNTVSNLATNSVRKMLPGASAMDEAEFLNSSVGSCPVAGSTSDKDTNFTVSNGFCNQYVATDLTTMYDDVLAVFETIAGLRKDEAPGEKIVGARRIDADETCSDKEVLRGHDGHTYCVPKEVFITEDKGYFFVPDKNDVHNKKSNLVADDAENKDPNLEGREMDNNPLDPNNKNYNGVTADASITCMTRGIEYYNKKGVLVGFEPLEWSYSTITNYEHIGYKDGLPGNEFQSSDNPGEVKADGCELKMNIKDKNPVPNMNSAYGEYITMATQRTSNWGIVDNQSAEIAAGVDIKHGSKRSNVTVDDVVSGDKSEEYAARISGSAFSATHDQSKKDKPIFMARETKKDEGDKLAWEYENMYYQRGVEDQNLLEGIKMIDKSSVAMALDDYYDENPLDNSYPGVIARYSGQSKDTVVAILDLLDYAEYLAEYKPAERYFMGDKKGETLAIDKVSPNEEFVGLFDFRDFAVFKMKETLIARAAEF